MEIENKNILNRLKRTEGQIRGIQKMIEDEKECMDVITQLSAVRSSIDRVMGMIVADNLKFYPLCEDPLCAVMQKNHPLAEKKSVRLEELLEYPFIIETPGCDNDILHLLERCGKEPKTSYSFRDDTLIMAFVKNGLGVTISQKLVMKAFANDVESRPLEPGRSRIIGLAFVKTMNSVVTKILLEYLKGMM